MSEAHCALMGTNLLQDHSPAPPHALQSTPLFYQLILWALFSQPRSLLCPPPTALTQPLDVATQRLLEPSLAWLLTVLFHPSLSPHLLSTERVDVHHVEPLLLQRHRGQQRTRVPAKTVASLRVQRWRAAERRHPTGPREYGLAHPQTLQDPILLMPNRQSPPPPPALALHSVGRLVFVQRSHTPVCVLFFEY